MSDYRIVLFEAAGQVTAIIHLFSEDDAAAARQARRLADDAAAELWREGEVIWRQGGRAGAVSRGVAAE